MAIQATPQTASDTPTSEEMITISIPRSTFDEVQEFIAALGSIMDAAEAKISSDLKGAKAASRFREAMPDLSGLGGLEGFSEELNAQSDARNGMGPMG